MFEQHVAQAQKAGVVYENYAILDRDGKATFKVPIREDGHEIRVMSSTREFGAQKFVEYEVNALTLDQKFNNNAASSAVWIDVEGAAFEVIAGGQTFFRSCKIAYLEVEAQRRWAGQHIFSELVPILAEFGLQPVMRDIQRSKWQFNVIFLHKDLLTVPAVEDAIDRHFDLLFSA